MMLSLLAPGSTVALAMHGSRIRRVVLGIGSNLGDRVTLVRSGAECLGALPGIVGLSQSSLYETRPVGGPSQGNYINAAVMLRTDRSALSLLQAALGIEARFGRVRRERNGPRTLDIDLLWIERETYDEPSLTVPHPRLHERAFALLPLLDVAADACDPQTGVRYQQLAAKLDQSGVRRLDDTGCWPLPHTLKAPQELLQGAE